MCISKTIKIYPNQHTDLLRFLFMEDYLKIKKGLELLSKAIFFLEFFDEKFSFVMLHKLAKFHHQTMFTSQVTQ